MEIEKYLIKIGIQPHLKGFYFLADALELVIKDRSYLQNVTKRLYVELAKKNKETPTTLERAMRHAIKSAQQNLSITSFIGNHSVELRLLKK